MKIIIEHKMGGGGWWWWRGSKQERRPGYPRVLALHGMRDINEGVLFEFSNSVARSEGRRVQPTFQRLHI
jgi:hypothetical protein